jgi:hypothetical protein
MAAQTQAMTACAFAGKTARLLLRGRWTEYWPCPSPHQHPKPRHATSWFPHYGVINCIEFAVHVACPSAGSQCSLRGVNRQVFTWWSCSGRKTTVPFLPDCIGFGIVPGEPSSIALPACRRDPRHCVNIIELCEVGRRMPVAQFSVGCPLGLRGHGFFARLGRGACYRCWGRALQIVRRRGDDKRR